MSDFADTQFQGHVNTALKALNEKVDKVVTGLQHANILELTNRVKALESQVAALLARSDSSDIAPEV